MQHCHKFNYLCNYSLAIQISVNVEHLCLSVVLFIVIDKFIIIIFTLALKYVVKMLKY